MGQTWERSKVVVMGEGEGKDPTEENPKQRLDLGDTEHVL